MKIKIQNWQIFCGLLILNLMIIWFYKECVFRYEIFYNLLKDQIDLSRIEHQVEIIRRWFDLNYLLVPVTMLFRFTFVSFILQFPLLFILDHVPFDKIFRTVMIASLAISAGSIIQGLILFLQPIDMLDAQTLNQIPLSLANLVQNNGDLSNSTQMVINSFNLFEFIWCAIIYFKFKAQMILKDVDILLLIFGVWLFLLITQWVFIEILTLLSL